MKKIVAVFIFFMFVLLVFPRDLVAGPFGFQAGMTVDDVKRLVGKRNLTKEGAHTYVCKKAPNGNSFFEGFLLTIDPTIGLVKVEAYSSRIVTGVYGSELKMTFSEMKDALTDIYGNCKSSYDFLIVGSAWRERRDFMTALLKKERFLLAYWEGDLKSEVTNILLEGRAESKNTGYVYVGYEFVGFSEYVNNQRKEEQKVLYGDLG